MGRTLPDAPQTGGLPPLVDARGPMGLEVERAVAHTARRLAARAPTFVLPLYSTVLAVESSAPGTPKVLDATRWLLVPQGTRVRLEVQSPFGTTLLLTPTPSLLALVGRTYPNDVPAPELRRRLATPFAAKRTTWVNELSQRYAFERAVCRKRGNAATTFLEVELLKEWFFVRGDQEAAAHARSSHLETHASALEKARAFIDAHLEDALSVSSLAKVAQVSPRALLRAFHKGLGVSPVAYVRARRLDEALLLLRAGKLDVSEVAARVGYRTLSAFSQAFRARFGERPSSVRQA